MSAVNNNFPKPSSMQFNQDGSESIRLQGFMIADTQKIKNCDAKIQKQASKINKIVVAMVIGGIFSLGIVALAFSAKLKRAIRLKSSMKNEKKPFEAKEIDIGIDKKVTVKTALPYKNPKLAQMQDDWKKWFNKPLGSFEKNARLPSISILNNIYETRAQHSNARLEEISAKERKINKLQQRLTPLEKEKKEWETMEKKLEAESEDLEDKIKNIDVSIKDTEKKIHTLQLEINNLGRPIDESVRVRNEISGKNGKIVIDIGNLKKELAMIKDNNFEQLGADTELKSTQNQIETTNTAIDNLKKAMEEGKKSNDTFLVEKIQLEIDNKVQKKKELGMQLALYKEAMIREKQDLIGSLKNEQQSLIQLQQNLNQQEKEDMVQPSRNLEEDLKSLEREKGELVKQKGGYQERVTSIDDKEIPKLWKLKNEIDTKITPLQNSIDKLEKEIEQLTETMDKGLEKWVGNFEEEDRAEVMDWVQDKLMVGYLQTPYFTEEEQEQGLSDFGRLKTGQYEGAKSPFQIKNLKFGYSNGNPNIQSHFDYNIGGKTYEFVQTFSWHTIKGKELSLTIERSIKEKPIR